MHRKIADCDPIHQRRVDNALAEADVDMDRGDVAELMADLREWLPQYRDDYDVVHETDDVAVIAEEYWETHELQKEYDGDVSALMHALAEQYCHGDRCSWQEMYPLVVIKADRTASEFIPSNQGPNTSDEPMLRGLRLDSGSLEIEWHEPHQDDIEERVLICDECGHKEESHPSMVDHLETDH